MFTFEANMDFEVRFLSDLKLVGCGWAECLAGTYQTIPKVRYRSTCQIEVFLSFFLFLSDSN
jgi:hypothetical protein